MAVSQGFFNCYITTNSVPLYFGITPMKQWILILCGHDYVESSAYFFRQKDLDFLGSEVRDTFAPGSPDMNPSGFNV